MISNTKTDNVGQPDSGNSYVDSLRTSYWSPSMAMAGLLIPLLVWVLAVGGSRFPAGVTRFMFPILATAMLIFPLITCRKRKSAMTYFPGFRQLGIEAAIAIPCIALCLLLNLTVMAISVRLWPDAPYAPEHLQRASHSALTTQFLVITVYSVLYTPLAEEVFFRGFLINVLRRHVPEVTAVILQALLFGVMHGYGLGATVSTVMLGVVLGIVYSWRKTVATSFLIHAGYNAVGFAVIISSMLTSGGLATMGVIPDLTAKHCVVQAVAAGSPAEQAGIVAGDIIWKINDHEIGSAADLLKVVASLTPKTTVDVYLKHGDQHLTKRVRLVRRDQLRAGAR